MHTDQNSYNMEVVREYTVMSSVNLQALQLINEDGPLDDGDALLERFFLYLAVACLLTHSRKGGHVLGMPDTKLFQNR